MSAQRTKLAPGQAVIVIDLYCRLSRDNDGTEHTVEEQERVGRKQVEALGFTVGMVHRDHAKSAWNPKVVRPEWLLLMKRLHAGDAHGVWVRDLDRFTRKPREGEDLLDLARSGTMVLSKREGKHDLSTARGVKRFREDMVDAAYESDRISERSSDGKRAKVAERGRSNASVRAFGRPGYLRPPGGYQPGSEPYRVPAPDELVAREAEAIRYAAERILAGEYLNAIANEWNAKGLTTTAGGLWDGGILRQMLSKPSLAGLAVHKGEIVGVLKDTEPVLDRETWDRLQAYFKGRRRGRPATEYLLSGIVRCGRCGNMMYGRPSGGVRNTREDGSVRREYWCQIRPNHPERCGRIRMDTRLADRFVEEGVLARLGDKRHADRLNKRAEKIEEARTKIAAELFHLRETGKGIAAQAMKRGHEWVDAAMGPIDARKEELTVELAKLTEADTEAAAALDAAVSWDKATLTQRRALVRRAFPDGLWIGPANTRGRGSSKDRARILVKDPTGSYTGGDREAS